jgi:hypothetical protein
LRPINSAEIKLDKQEVDNMRCTNCGKELTVWDLLVRKNKRRPVCRGGYDCYRRLSVVTGRMVRVLRIAEKYYKFAG